MQIYTPSTTYALGQFGILRELRLGYKSSSTYDRVMFQEIHHKLKIV